MTRLSISVDNLSKVFSLEGGAERRAVDSVSFSVNEGERIGIIGRNGAGKTTLLQVLAGIGKPTSGTLDVQGRVNALMTIGLGLAEELSGVENIYIDGELTGRSRAEVEELIPSIVAFADLGQFIDRPVRSYSTGMKARLAFSMAVHIDPEILIVDEALSVGDNKFSTKATNKMRELASRGRILLLVSHSMSAICDMCTRCLWMDDGKIRMDGPPDEVTAAYLNEVRASDDAQLLRRFRTQLINEAVRPGWSIDAMQLVTRADGARINLPQTREPTVLQLDVSGPQGTAFGTELEIQRLDGLKVCVDGSRSTSAFRFADTGTARIAADLGELPLNQGIYSALVTILTRDGVMVRRSMLFEVVNARPHRGGLPVLVTPTEVISQRISG